ncbi:fumarylacetoacetate hydrolase family protein [Microbacterium telephonicum]|uniref:Fumarylacetoacetate (FAA) hydrolase family protein n=1 Tax=Microbacterium telephonicum TaxID=1714841 RepID=A0A498BR61_9MICO|nr:fumarylacetoacetate hydrolase family protein [Microbacterium telephonicum]RLK46593.1 fumarylacetoacetate (FAA) hydrolase family protein [Microbacterium telephonicum]
MSTDWTGGIAAALPADPAALLVGRVWDPAAGGPSVVTLRGGEVIDVSAAFPTMRALTETADPAAAVAAASGPVLGTVAELLASTAAGDSGRPRLLSPIDLQVVKAAGVTFPVSMLERVIEERARGEASEADAARQAILGTIGSELRELVPGSEQAARLKEYLIAEGLWSQYLEVGIGPDAEVFTKAPVLATVGTAVEVGIREDSQWNNPEPEVVLVVASTGAIVGATLGNDVNLRDIEGRSALLLGHAKDNNASASVGPFIRLFDAGFSLDDVREATVTLTVSGADGFTMGAQSHMTQISRDPADLVGQAIGPHHRYPDGFVLYLGTMFAPIDDRDEPGRGFTHHVGDVVTISTPALGALVNRVQLAERTEPWDYGIADLFAGLARRGLLDAAPIAEVVR